MELTFSGALFEWRGPSPFHFVAVPPPEAELIAEVAAMVTYGWGVIPVSARSGATTWTTSLFPKQGGYLVPVKDAIRRAERMSVGDVVTITLALDLTRPGGVRRR
jgi:hypothetical protein